MRHLTVSTLVILVVLLGSAGESFALPECPTGFFSILSTWTNCFGTETYANGNKYVGEWKNGKLHGQGTFTFASGIKYVGGHKDGKWHGQGTFTYTDGRVEEGIWEYGKLKYAQKVSPTVTAKKSAKKSSGSNQSSLPECPGSPTKSLNFATSWNNCKGTHTLADGRKYVGEFKNGWRHGQGTFTNNFGGKYVGEFKNGLPNGQGTETSASGKSGYVGEWKDGKMHGQGTLTFANGDRYVGEWKDGTQHGQGTYTFADGEKYVGEHKDGKKHGQGTHTLADGRVEEGIWENGQFKYAQKITPFVIGKKPPPPSKGESFALPECPGSPKTGPFSGVRSWNNCEGTYTYADGRKYVGGWKIGFPNGQGTETDTSGNRYVGEYKYGTKHGQGTKTYASGSKYVGEWKKGFQNGQGTETFANGTQYVGEYKDGKMHGQGTFTLPDGKSGYVGEFKDNKFNGQGTQTYADGRKYVGEWKDGKKHGQGTITYGSKNRQKGDNYVGGWKHNKYHGQGTWTHPNGTQYVGEYKDGNRHGRGNVTYSDGKVFGGIWENNVIKIAQKVTPTVTAKKTPEPSSKVQKENERLRKKIARLEKEKKQKPKPKQVAKRTPPKKSPPPKSATSGSGFFISKLGHVLTNEHVVRGCGSVTVGDNSKKQVNVTLVETDKRNDLALLKISSTKMASADTKSLIRKLGITIVPLASEGLLRSEDVELGERVLVAGYPYGDIFSDTIKVTGGMVSASRGMGDDTGQFQMDAAVQPGNSGGPIYDENGNIVGVVIAQLNKLKVAKAIGSLPELVNFGIKASTVRQFLTSSGLPTKWSKRSKSMTTRELAKIAKNQTVMVVCHH